jgi:hypothetical protein
MRLPRTRFTLRRMMVAVAIISVVLCASREVWRLDRRSWEYLRKAEAAARKERDWRRAFVGCVESETEAMRTCALLRVVDPNLAKEWTLEAANRSLEVRDALKLVAHHSLLRRKYERARPAGAATGAHLAERPSAPGAVAVGGAVVRRGHRLVAGDGAGALKTGTTQSLTQEKKPARMRTTRNSVTHKEGFEIVAQMRLHNSWTPHRTGHALRDGANRKRSRVSGGRPRPSRATTHR